MNEHSALSVRLDVWIHAPPERVFQALVDPEALCSWWAVPGAYETKEATVDVRVGGGYRLSGPSEQLGGFEVSGEYLTVDPPRELAYTWNPGWDERARGSIVRFRLRPERDGTLLQMEHTGFATEPSAADHRAGWPGVIDALRRFAEEEAVRGGKGR